MRIKLKMAKTGLTLLIFLFFVKSSLSQDTSPTTTTTTTLVAPNFVRLSLVVGNSTFAVVNRDRPLEISIEGPLDQAHQFWIFEAHSHFYGLSLTSNASSVASGSSQILKNLNDDEQFLVTSHPGLVMYRTDNQTSPKVYLSCNATDQNVTVLLLVRGYSADTPVPGLDNDQEIDISENGEIVTAAANLNVIWDEDLVRLRFVKAGHVSGAKSQDDYRYQVYQMFLTEEDYDETSFLTQMQQFFFEDQIVSKGRLVSESFVRQNDNSTFDVVFAAYPGTAALYSIVVSTSITAANGTVLAYSSVYVVSGTYGCNLDSNLKLSCYDRVLTLTKVVAGITLIAGFFIAVAGHHCFPVTQFFFALFVGFFLSYMVVSVPQVRSLIGFTAGYGLSVGVGLAVALLLSFCWYKFGNQILATLLSTTIMGFLLGCIVVYSPSLNTITMANNASYWGTLAGFTFGSPLLLICCTNKANILSCSFIGTYTFIISIDFLIGTNLKYNMVNVIRRATVADFNWALISYPFQGKEIGLLSGWIVLIFASIISHYYTQTSDYMYTEFGGGSTSRGNKRYGGTGTRADLNNHANQLNPNNWRFGR